MHELEMKLRDICEIKEKLVCYAKEEVVKDPSCIDVEQLGQTVDMIKDLCQAEKDACEAHVHKTSLRLMEEMGDSSMMGYDHWRTSSGRFADKGTGHYAGYTPTKTGDASWAMQPWMDNNTLSTVRENSRFGYPYEQYKEAKNRQDRMGMTQNAEEHTRNMVSSMRDIWKDADPQLREKLKHEMTGLAEEMDL